MLRIITLSFFLLFSVIVAQAPDGFSTTDSTASTTSSSSKPRIIGGRIVTDSIVPFLANLHIFDKTGIYSTCSATVLSSQWILTAAHCFFYQADKWTTDLESTYAVIGSKDVETETSTEKYLFEKLYLHKEFNQSALANPYDLAIIKLVKPITPGKFAPITIGDAPAPETTVIVAGYGEVDNNNTKAEFGKQAEMVAQSYETCIKMETEKWQEYIRDDIMVCATSVGFPTKAETDICYGDGGGPLFAGQDEEIYQYGITSFSTSSCGAVGATPWFTRLAPFKDAIYKVINDEASADFMSNDN